MSGLQGGTAMHRKRRSLGQAQQTQCRGPVARKQQPYIMPKAICQPECLIWGSRTVICRRRRPWRDKLVTQTFRKYTAKLLEVRQKGQEVHQTSSVWLPVLHPGVRLSSLFHFFQLEREKWTLWWCDLFWQSHSKVYCFCLHVSESEIWQRFKAVAQVFMEELRVELRANDRQITKTDGAISPSRQVSRALMFILNMAIFISRVFKCWSRLLMMSGAAQLSDSEELHHWHFDAPRQNLAFKRCSVVFLHLTFTLHWAVMLRRATLPGTKLSQLGAV